MRLAIAIVLASILAQTSGQASTCKVGQYFDAASSTCKECVGCGSYQDEPGQSSCKTATIETCPANSVPKTGFFLGARSLEDACKPVEPGYYYQDDPDACYPVRMCSGCGSYQDEPGKSSCKNATVETCPANHVPSFATRARTSLEQACQKVPAGSFYVNEAGASSSTCFPVRVCSGCGSYQDQEGSTTCKTASKADCPANHVPVFTSDSSWATGKASLAAACQEVPAGYFYEDTAGDSSATCYPVAKCVGCGSFQDEAGASSCKTATVESCPEGHVPDYILSFSSPATKLEDACKPVPPGRFYDPVDGGTSSTCFKVSSCVGCGSFQDLAGQQSCKTATKEDCPANHVPSFASGATSTVEACKQVPAGSFYVDEAGTSSSTCFPVQVCSGCGSYQDQEGSTTCKSASKTDCPANHVPRYASRWSPSTTLTEACKEVPAGFYFEDQNGDGADTCYPVQACTGCGSFQDEPGASSCKTADMSTCPENMVPMYVSSNEPATTLRAACKDVPAGYFFTESVGDSSRTCFPVQSCSGCGAFQDLPGQQSCKTATKEECPDNHVPKNTWSFEKPATSINEACKVVPAGSIYLDDVEKCFPVEECFGCGIFQDERMATSCKRLTKESCGEGKVPAYVSRGENRATTAEDACKPVPLGFMFSDDEAKCFPVSECSGCGMFQDTAKQSQCKRATKDSCGEAKVPKYNKEATTSLEDACKEVPVGTFYTDDEEACFPVAECRGCGVYQDERGATSCKTGDCGDDLPLYHSGSAKPTCVTRPVPAGHFLNGNCVYKCSGCGSFQEEQDQRTCNIATVDDCPEGEFPIIVRGATSLGQVCAKPPPLSGYDANLCSFNSCFGSDVAQLFSCDSFRALGHGDCKNLVVTDSEWSQASTDTASEEYPMCFVSGSSTEGEGLCDCANPPSPPANLQQTPSDDSGSGTAIALGVTGAVLGVLAIGGLGFFIYRHKSRQDDEVKSIGSASVASDTLRILP